MTCFRNRKLPLHFGRAESSFTASWVTKVPAWSTLQFVETGVQITLASARMEAPGSGDEFSHFRGTFTMLSSAAKKSAAPSSVALFARNFFKFPSMIGSVVPSSKFLVKDLMAEVDWDRARVLVEFGPGVGTLTREILKRMRPDAVLVAIELNED